MTSDDNRYIQICSDAACCGCSACASACPVSCITMEAKGAEGFLRPVVDVSRCVGCGRCKTVCPALHAVSRNEDAESCLIARALSDETRRESSSGGIFSLLAMETLGCGGVVYGAVMSDDMSGVHHSSAINVSQLAAQRKSKYIQSEIGGIFSDVRESLAAGRQVLFSGTPCQVAGLKAFLGCDYENLLTIDVICHGVASPALWRMLLDHYRSRTGSEPVGVNFRDKRTGWKGFSLSLSLSDGSEVSEPFGKSAFGRLFINNICLRECCYDCRFKGGGHCSDVTVGDAWGQEAAHQEICDDLGASVVIPHTERGGVAIERIRGEMLLEEVPLSEALRANSFYYSSVGRHPKREEYLALLEAGGRIDDMLRLVRAPVAVRILRRIGRMLGI